MEEALTGMGMTEGTAFGSAFKGELLALRCLLRKEEFLDDGVGGTSSVAGRNVTASSDSLFIAGSPDDVQDGVQPMRKAEASCGKQFAEAIALKMRRGGYTGMFLHQLQDA